MQLGKQEGQEWVSYQVWESKEGVKSKGEVVWQAHPSHQSLTLPKQDADLLFIHGINDYG